MTMVDLRQKRRFPSRNHAWLSLLSGVVLMFWSGLLFAIYRSAAYNEVSNLSAKMQRCQIAFVIGIFMTVVGLLLVLLHTVRRY